MFAGMPPDSRMVNIPEGFAVAFRPHRATNGIATR